MFNVLPHHKRLFDPFCSCYILGLDVERWLCLSRDGKFANFTACDFCELSGLKAVTLTGLWFGHVAFVFLTVFLSRGIFPEAF